MCSGLSLFAVLVETSAVSYLLPAAECELDLSLKEKGMLGSAVFIGKIFPNVKQLSDLTNGYAKRVCEQCLAVGRCGRRVGPPKYYDDHALFMRLVHFVFLPGTFFLATAHL